MVDPEDDPSLARGDAFFQSFNENLDGNVIICDVPAARSRYQAIGHFLPLRSEYLDEVLRWESRGQRHFLKCCRGCGAAEPRFRCRDECMGRWMFCRACIVAHHAYTPLHWVEEWLDEQLCFQRTCLKALGLRVQLVHPPGDPCDLPAPAHKDFTVIHSNGIHHVSVNFCRCARGRDLLPRQQLMRNGWWPASVASPQTCATIACLRQFHKINVLSKVAVYEYYRALQHLTDNTGASRVIDKRRVFMFIISQYRHIQLLKRGGRGHVLDGVATTQQGQLALRCPACPHPGRNLPPDWASASAADSFLYRLFVAQDANFRLVNAAKSSYQKDPPMGDGWAYFVAHPEYMKYIKEFTDECDISTCSGFAAIFLANLKRVLGLRTTGVAAVCCSRHNLIRPNGVGDLQKGERFANMTYVLAASLRAAGVQEVLHSYDVACIFGINLWSRNATLPPHLRIAVAPEKFVTRVPKFHLTAHKPVCQAPQSLGLTGGAGMTHGETVEQNWFIMNKAAAQTKPMGPGNRQGTLDDMFGYYNKTCKDGLEYTLPKRMGNAVKGYAAAYPEFQQLDDGIRSHDPTIAEAWLNDERVWQMDKSKPCPYEYLAPQSSIKKVELELQLEEQEATANGTAVLHECTPSSLIKLGLEIQHSQRLLSIDKLSQKNPTTAQQVELLKRSRALKKRIAAYRKKQRIYMPGLASHLEATRRSLSDESVEAEDIKLFLPSELENDAVRAAVCAAGLPRVEERLRDGESHESLDDLRRALRARTVTNTFRTQQVRGITMATRTRTAFDKISKRVHTAKLQYRFSRNALLRLRGHGSWEETLRVLDDDSVRALNERSLTAEEKAERVRAREISEVDFAAEGGVFMAGTIARGESSRTLSWIWYSVPQCPSLTDPIQNEALRIEYLKSRARRDRYREEIRLLEEEMRRTIASLSTDAVEWEQRASARNIQDDELLEGLRSYAREQAAIARYNAERYGTKWAAIRARGAAALLHDFSGVLSLPDPDSLRELEELEDAAEDADDEVDDVLAS
ncbi:hypothetical protein BD626DRAFT_573203 [Schizophyllum amplum]|uniref:CxC2-like cysteine cluster KDZ transposase-associated domain-containing protein n=1 Tax=Schizophyllum amplum TaxID=97359 RepID=A0A550C2J8_9AGAR|nr:hypothetical protein BD626DRAFT_573203 [Auriculariopsis ampla]